MSPLQLYPMSNELLNHAPFPSFIISLEGDMLKWNNLGEIYFGYTVDDFQHTSLQDSLFASIHEDTWLTILTSEKPVRFNHLRLLASNGEFIAISLLTKRCLLDDENALFVMATPLEATITIDDGQQELIDFRNGIQSSFMTVTVDSEGFIVYCNQAFLKASNWTPKRVLGKTFWKLFPEKEDSIKLSQNIWKTLIADIFGKVK